MYPTLYDAFKDLFGVSIPFFKLLQSFGFFVAVAFLLCAWVFAKELNRKDLLGLFKNYKESFRKIITGSKLSQTDLAINFAFAFLIGWKLIPVFYSSKASIDPRSFVLSSQGSLLAGVVVAVLWTAARWWYAKKKELPEPKEIEERIKPGDHVGNMTLIAALFGFLGAKLFHLLENFSSFLEDPAGMIFSFSGLTMYGGLIVGGIAVLVYAKRQGMNIFHVMDACAPGLLLAYGVGRIGCHVAGDGDWGIVNAHPTPGFLPQWLWAYDYPNNVNGQWNPYIEGTGEYIATALGIRWEDVHRLVAPVYPTPLYEAIINILLFGVFWKIRKRFSTPGLLFATYLVCNGLERFFIELIRVNEVLFHIGSWGVTQAEIIAVSLMLLGLAGIVWLKRRKQEPEPPPPVIQE